jgi:DNA-binding response OmpR family regulator
MASRIPTILVVEDEPGTRELLRETLEEAGYAAVAAPDATEALERLEGDVDLVLLDIMLPGLDGLEFCRRIRATETEEHLPIVMLTALGTTGQRHAGFEAGADDYITKPFDLRELLDRVQVWIEAGQRLRAAQHRETGRAPITPLRPAAGATLHEEMLRYEGLLTYLVAQAANRPGFLASALMPYAEAQGWDEATLAEALGCPLATLTRLLLRPRPLPYTWDSDVASIADACGADPTALATTLRAVEDWERTRRR